MWERRPENGVLDFFLGFLGVFGLLIEFIRNSYQEIDWLAFVWGWAVSWGGSFVLWLVVWAVFVNALSGSA